jgi:hypothetical protein
MLGWDQYVLDKNHARTPCIEVVFLHPMGSAGHVVPSVKTRTQNINPLFSYSCGLGVVSIKSVPEHVTPNLLFASGGIYGSHCAFGTSGVSNVDALFFML